MQYGVFFNSALIFDLFRSELVSVPEREAF